MALTDKERQELEYLDNPEVDLSAPPVGLLGFMISGSKNKRKERVVNLRTKLRMSEAGLDENKNWREYYNIRGEEEKRFDERFAEIDYKNNIDKEVRNGKANKRIKEVGIIAQVLGWAKIVLPFILPFVFYGDKVVQTFLSYSYADLALNMCVGILFVIFGKRISKDINESTKTYLWIMLISSGVLWITNLLYTQKSSLILILFIYSIYALAKFKSAIVSETEPVYKIVGWKWLLVILSFFLIIFVGSYIDSQNIQPDLQTNQNNESLSQKVNYNITDITDKSYFSEYEILDVGSILIPKDMEVQAGVYKEINDKYRKEFMDKFDYEISGEQIVFQQKGLNSLNKDSFGTYVRVMIETEQGKIGDYDKLMTKLELSDQEMSEVSETLKTEMVKNTPKSGIKILEWHGVSIVTVNGVDSLKTSYTRQIDNNPPVLVSMYTFFNNDRYHRLTLSYRVSESEQYKNKLENVLRSFVITNIR